MSRLDSIPVAPRVVAESATPEYRPLLDDAVGEWLASGEKSLMIVGGRGSGRTTAIAHLRSSLADEPVDFVDADPGDEPVRSHPDGRVVMVFSEDPFLREFPSRVLRLAPWTRDEVMEWLLATCPDRCGSVWSRLEDCDGGFDWACGNPTLWSIALERMAADDSVRDPRSAVDGWIRDRLDARGYARARVYAVRLPLPVDARRVLRARLRIDDEELVRVLSLEPVYTAFAGSVVAQDIVHDRVRPLLTRRSLSRSLVVDEAVSALRANGDWIESVIARPPTSWQLSPLAKSVLVRAVPGWRPGYSAIMDLRGARLAHVEWSKLDLRRSAVGGACFDHASLESTDFRHAAGRRSSFRHARLRGAEFASAELVLANFSGADLREAGFRSARLRASDFRGAECGQAVLALAKLERANLANACFRGADFSRADLRCANVRGCDFRDCNFDVAMLTGLDLRGVRIDGATFGTAALEHCVLEGVFCPGADFQNAWLVHSTWTGAQTPGADFRDANLTGARLAEVDWRRVDLRGANLIGVDFHLGSSRSGLIESSIASEGSRTGFYTDEYEEQRFKAPEEIRKADLRDADLRGANIDGVDFYLVDLRGARCDPAQREQLVRTRAIL